MKIFGEKDFTMQWSFFLSKIDFICIRQPVTFEAFFTIMELPAMIVGIANLKTCQKGKFHGIIPNITPKGSYDINPLLTLLSNNSISRKKVIAFSL